MVARKIYIKALEYLVKIKPLKTPNTKHANILLHSFILLMWCFATFKTRKFIWAKICVLVFANKGKVKRKRISKRIYQKIYFITIESYRWNLYPINDYVTCDSCNYLSIKLDACVWKSICGGGSYLANYNYGATQWVRGR